MASTELQHEELMVPGGGARECSAKLMPNPFWGNSLLYCSVSMSLDSRGVLRGSCTSCLCDGYDGGSEKKKCTKCDHPPGKHENLSTSTRPTTTTRSVTGGDVANLSTAGSAVTHYDHQLMSYPQRPQLPMCVADGCTNMVWYEPGLQEDLQVFDYCSPECRDRHLLPIRRQQISVELEQLKQELQRVAAREISAMAAKRHQSQEQLLQQRQPSREQPVQQHKSTLQQQQSKMQPSSTVSSGASLSPSTASTKGPGDEATTKVQKKKTKQKNIVFMIRKHCNKPSGLVLSKKPYISEAAEIGFVIVGVVQDSPAYSSLQDDKLRLLDVIKTVNDKPCSNLHIPGVDLQDSFEKAIEDKDFVKLCIDRSIALPPFSSSVAFAKRNSPKHTHVMVLRYSAESTDDKYGLTLSSYDFAVQGVSKGSPADLSRMKYDDKVFMYVITSESEENVQGSSKLVSETTQSAVNSDLAKAHAARNSVVLFVQKPENL